VSAIDSTLPPGAPSRAPNGFSSLSSEEFIKIIFTELQNQDPTAPSDSASLLNQLSSLRSIQSDMDLSAKLETLVTQNQLASAGNLIGEFVSGLAFGNQRASGWVVSISRTADGPILNLDNGYRLPFSNVDEIVDGELLVPVKDDDAKPAPPKPPTTPGDNTGDPTDDPARPDAVDDSQGDADEDNGEPSRDDE